MGATPQEIARHEAKMAAEAAATAAEEEHFEVWDENWDAFLFFLSLGTQWSKLCLVRTMGAPTGGSFTATEVRRDGLPYPRIESAARLQGIPRSRWPALFADISLMEDAVLARDAELRAEAALR